jgi:hypothetical protein
MQASKLLVIFGELPKRVIRLPPTAHTHLNHFGTNQAREPRVVAPLQRSKTLTRSGPQIRFQVVAPRGISRCNDATALARLEYADESEEAIPGLLTILIHPDQLGRVEVVPRVSVRAEREGKADTPDARYALARAAAVAPAVGGVG